MKTHRELVDGYLDASWALAMEQVAVRQGELAGALEERLARDPGAAVPRRTVKRCRAAIRRAFAPPPARRVRTVLTRVLIAAVLCGETEQVEVREGASPLEFTLCSWDESGTLRPLPRQELLLFTPFQPETGSPYGVSLLRSMPFMTEVLLKIYYALGQNWERVGNVHFAVLYKPGSEDGELVRQRSLQIAREWSSAMESTKNGYVRDFVAAGDVDIKVIGADNQVLDSEVPVRQILEQLIARTGIPPFMLGLNWSSTERMSSQQADLLTTEMDAIRRTLTPVLERICRYWLRSMGWGCDFSVEWDTIDLQDEVEDARAQLYLEQARKLRIENDKNDKEENR